MATKEMDLGSFDGNDVIGTSIKITKAGDGLSKALKTDPQLLHMGDKVFIVMEAVVGPITFDPTGDEGDVIRKHSAQARTVTLVDEKVVRAVLDAQIERNEQLREAETGQSRLPLGSAPATQHVAGLHKRKRKGCPLCYPTGHGDGEGDADNPLPPARVRRSRKATAKKAPAKKRASKSAK